MRKTNSTESRKELFKQGALPRRDLDSADVALAQARTESEVTQKQLDDLKRIGEKRKSEVCVWPAFRRAWQISRCQRTTQLLGNPLSNRRGGDGSSAIRRRAGHREPATPHRDGHIQIDRQSTYRSVPSCLFEGRQSGRVAGGRIQRAVKRQSQPGQPCARSRQHNNRSVGGVKETQ